MRYFFMGKPGSIGGARSKINLDMAIRLCLVLIVTALPLFMLPQTYSVFDLPEAMLFIVLTSLILCTWIIKITQEGHIKWYRSPLDIPTVTMIAIVTISTILSVNPITSLTGSSLSDRNESFLVFLSYIFLFVAANQFTAGNSNRKQHLLKFFVTTASAISIYAILQHFGIDYFQYDVSGIDTKRPPGTLGQPAYLGMYLAMVLPISITLFSIERRRLDRIIYALSAIVVVIALVLTYTRGSWLAAIVAVAIVISYSTLKQSKYRVRLLVLVACIFFAVLLAVVLSGSLNLLSERVESALELKGSAAQRLGIWNSTLNLTKERPLLGWGIETFEDIHPKAETRSLVRLEGGPIRADRPHNQILYLSYSMGFIGLLTYLWVIITAFLFGLKALKNLDGNDSLMLIGIMSALVSCIVSEQFLFSLAAVTPIFWLMVGLLVSNASRFQVVNISHLKAQVLRCSMVAIAFISLAMAAAFITADVLYERGNESFDGNDLI
ncbi:MAG: O-antigen ligase family protein, partial [Actinomycetota bacterium]|nr:O-antigen ligase family protein [Actinomycetota bacterium]